MFNPIREMFKNIFKEKGMFLSSLISLTVVFILLDLFVFGIFNLNNFKAKMENSNQAIVYVNTMTEDEISNFQGKLLQTNGVKTIKYTSKETALGLLEQELNVDLSQEENPLYDSFYIYVDRKVNADVLKEELLKNSEIIELDMRSDEINRVNRFSQNLDKVLLFGGVGLLLFMLILMSNIVSLGVRARRSEIRELISTGVSGFKIKLAFFFEGILLTISSGTLGFYIFYRLQRFLVSGVSILNSSIVANATRKELLFLYLFTLILGFIIIFYLNFIGTYKYFKKNKNNNDNIDNKNNKDKNVKNKVSQNKSNILVEKIENKTDESSFRKQETIERVKENFSSVFKNEE